MRPRRPLPLTARPWRALAYLLVRLPLPAAGALAVLLPIVVGGWIGVAVALPLLVAYVLVAVAAAPAERRAVALLGDVAVRDPHREPDGPGTIALLRLRVREATTWREVANALLAAVLAPLDGLVLLTLTLGSLGLLAAPLLIAADPVAMGPWEIDSAGEAWFGCAVGLALLLGGAYIVTALAAAHAARVRALLGPRGDELRDQVTELARSRVRLIDAFDVERRRIERDLHDGAQQQLVALAMTLDLARIELEGSGGEAARLVERAHAQATRTIAELRDLIHAIHPPILAERGLGAAVRALADRAALPVRTAVEVDRRLPEGVETAAYFVVSETLANAVKHSGAAAVDVTVRLADATLAVEVRDDGRGGADAARGSGLAGLGDRVAAVGGRLTLSSPPGGPTVVRAEISCPPGGMLRR
ncbi:sensor histidine kinase [Conexibacter woesei]|uniref:histidine kinase n=1 Tax=Conexibacter woesei (strain DSM 14684 / CCUG 47730 / CIP 108061 / JCM 11494 / NBRC 100937 / ID131577) TaxID=469383 RepID=D3F924_CONWI|nr:sensor histidine kinase [Conexibacter woesei]ADB53019.1 integral membrane sensor signal transduction histidine kinase [Conexibacter woesei DSM 14684]